ncbi:glycosyltransferase family 2 protein [Anaeromassilibacillus senegalensis]|uniref:Glycosyltransferase n=1 Tax=Anaeromassilibacillus senegalensis TaxID=1673717 RepID=A0ABS9CRX3_9FIRM|nr:glycosyltransferase [Anaeromassilibacillus senegalensis]MCF2652699.1 glycosyltransferase [Anaeromassilibacillus senegalensis]
MQNRISVIVPVYNVVHYLEQCVESILSQKCNDLEVILIDDGSTDGSGALCDELARKDARIHVIHQENAGAAAAKNAGLRVATGEYLAFVDSDDYLEPGAYPYLLKLIQENNADVVRGAFRNIFKTHETLQNNDCPRTCMTGTDFLRRFTTDWTCSLLWDKLYRREIFDGIFFEEGHKIDDEYFTYRGIINAKCVVCDDRIIYNYRKRASSVMVSASSGSQILLDRIDCLSRRRSRIHQEVPALAKEFDLHFLEMMIILSHDPYCSDGSIQQIRLALSGYFRETGHSSPPLALWRSLWKVRFAPAEQLVAKRNPVTVQESEDYFA